MSSQPQYPFMMDHAVRFDTFRSWPKPEVSKVALASNGFFYKGVGDMVQCFTCGVKLTNWKEKDCIAADHFMHSPKCEAAKRKLLDVAFLMETLGQAFTKITELSDQVSTLTMKVEAVSRISNMKNGLYGNGGTQRHSSDTHMYPVGLDVCDGPEED